VKSKRAVDRLEPIVNAFDGLMVARGDLGVELPLEQVPLVQSGRCSSAGRPAGVATQMLDSMIENSRPTRAEASDVANAVLDGADAVMLSGETSVGKYPTITVQTMSRIIQTTEAGDFQVPRLQHDPRTRGGVITQAASNIARAVGARALVAFSQTGDTVAASQVALRSALAAFTPDPSVPNRLTCRGAWNLPGRLREHTDAMFRQVDPRHARTGRGLPGGGHRRGHDAGWHAGVNTVRIHQLGSLS
jgi:pyruvate kinase